MPAYDLAGVEDNQNSFKKNAGRENCAKGEWQEKDGGVNVELIRISTKVYQFSSTAHAAFKPPVGI